MWPRALPDIIGDLDPAGGDHGREDEGDLVAHPARGMLVDEGTLDAGEVHHGARAEHELGEVGRLPALMPLKNTP